MKRLSRNLMTGSIFTLPALTLLAGVIGCDPTNRVTPGAPALVAFSVVTPAGEAAELVTEAGPQSVPPLSHFFALFDRILDPTGVEVVDSDGGLTAKEGVADVRWTGGAIESTSFYIPNGHHKLTFIPAAFGLPFNVGPSLTITPASGLPSGATVTVKLNAEKVRSHDQLHSFVPDVGVPYPLTFQTEPLQVTTDEPQPVAKGVVGPVPPGQSPPVTADFVLHVTFNNHTAPITMDAIQAVVTVAGVPVPGFRPLTAQDPMNPAVWMVSPPNSGWPAGAAVMVTIGTTAMDNFRVALAAPATASFTVAQ
ncbi:MAG: hypothetical protein ABIS92_17660 [Polyangia bacterium]